MLKPPQIDAQGIDEAVDGIERILFGDVTQVGIAGSRGGTCVAEEGLDMPKAQPLLQEMGCETVAKGVN